MVNESQRRPPLTHLLFDFDGTLADSRKNISNSLNHALTEQGRGVVDPALIHPLIGKKNLEETFLFFYPNLNSQDLTGLLADFRAYQLAHVEQELEVFPGVRDTLEMLSAHALSLAIFTTKNYLQVASVLEALKLRQYFAVIYGTGLPYGEKPEASCVTYILSQLPASTAGAIAMVGDSTVDAQAAQLSGIRFIGVGHGVDSPETLSAAGAEVVLSTFSQLQGLCKL